MSGHLENYAAAQAFKANAVKLLQDLLAGNVAKIDRNDAVANLIHNICNAAVLEMTYVICKSKKRGEAL